MSTRVFIMGSCVSRDSFEFLGPEFSLTEYVARQSLISIGRPVATDTIPADELDSAFQRRMLSGDLAGNALAQIDKAGEIDLLLWDLTDERLGVHPGGDGWFTRTIEGVGADFYPEDLPHHPFGSDEHFALWAEAAEHWIDALAARELLSRTVMLQVPWAAVTTNGLPTPASFGLTAQDANAASFRYQRVIMDLAPELPMLRPRQRMIARPGHQWGLAPFHYTEEIYTEIATSVKQLLR
ncbi:DUF6270 domain-containing protein [Naumannella halotolerans]|uniref:DUF6270 domain-containing protein n=1 Tax=Naumannella halotolerans TaxID=993414 RepID=UPI00370DBE3D